MCNVVPSGAEAYGKLYPETSSDGVRPQHYHLMFVLSYPISQQDL